MFPLPWKKVCGRPCMRVREGVAPTGVEVCRNDHDVEDLLYHHESVGWSRKQGQAGNEEAGHADDGHMAKKKMITKNG